MLLTALFYVVAVLAFLLLVGRSRSKGRLLGWLVGLICLVGFLWRMGVLR